MFKTRAIRGINFDFKKNQGMIMFILFYVCFYYNVNSFIILKKVEFYCEFG